MIFGLIGGENIKKYTIADFVWNKISEISGVDFEFKIFSIKSFAKLCAFYWTFTENKDFVGFNVALPWKTEILKLVDCIDSGFIDYKSINTVVKEKNENQVCGYNTDILGIKKPLLKRTAVEAKNILVVGAGGAGLPTAIFLSSELKAKVFLFDINKKDNVPKHVIFLDKISEIEKQKYDIIINATEIGKFYLGEKPDKFSMPLSYNLLNKIIKNNTIVQEMNYFPHNSEMLNYAISKNLVVISGIEMLVYQAVASFELYTQICLSEIQIEKIIEETKRYAIMKEDELFR